MTNLNLNGSLVLKCQTKSFWPGGLTVPVLVCYEETVVLLRLKKKVSSSGMGIQLQGSSGNFHDHPEKEQIWKPKAKTSRPGMRLDEVGEKCSFWGTLGKNS